MARPSVRTILIRAGLAVWDMASWALATTFMVAERYNFHVLTADERQVIYQYAVLAMALQLVIGFLTKLYRGRHTIGSFDEAVNIAAVTIIIGGGLMGFFYFFAPPGYPRGVTVLVPFGAVVLMTAGRFVIRTIFSSINSSTRDKAQDVIVYGAGNAGQQLARLLAYDPDAPYRIVGFVDDDRDKRHLRIHGARVLGTGDDLVKVANRAGVQTVVVAIPTAKRELMRRVSSMTEPEGINVLVMPNTQELIHGNVTLNQLHQLDVADLLGRSQIKTDLSSIAGYLSGRVVLVTGAGGSIGSEIARQVHKFGPKELVMLDRDESLLHGVQLSIYKQGLLDTPNMVLCDIRDAEALDRVFADHRPDVVFHAAALKHLPMLEQYPMEGWKTNVEGSLNLLRMAEKYEVTRFVNVSTDKAADATSVLGKTKRIAEELTAHYARKTGRTYLSVRFGNVLGSRGSMLHTFTNQIEQGGPITVTHPDITRYFMTIPEACELVIQAGAIGEPGDVLVLDMGEPVKILDVAKGLIARSGKDIKIIFTGLRPNEKMHEVLFSGDEDSKPTSHPMIEQVQVPPLDPARLDEIDGNNPEDMEKLTAQTTAEAARLRNLEQAGINASQQ
ncbi:polysaccharide biosynthesis protein [Propionibacteriaceae bacterium Y1923]|uniref:polysaccharide biosynthesis protein n=1 Tax=Aestuariimicrobium sp. Y1814 TaxID=3418742 RepID=UPI003C228D20